MCEIHRGIMVASADPAGKMIRKRSSPLPGPEAAPRVAPAAAEGPSDAALLVHDVRHLLAIAQGEAEVLAQTLPDEERQARARAILDSVAQAGRLCEDLLACAASGRKAAFEDVDLGTVATSATGAIRARSGDRVDVQHEGPDGRVLVRGRAGELERALLNLMWNAIEAMQRAKVESPRLDLSWGRDARGPFLQVRDYGPGLTRRQLAELAPAFRSTGANGKVARGLGLAGVQRILQEHEAVLETAPPAAGPGAVLRMQFGVQRELEFGA